jgi:pimeloyl-ACP methyl ester carboxylesterase
VPTLIVVGQLDQLFSAGDGAARSDVDAVLARERACYPPAARLEIEVLPDTGHALTIHPTAPRFFALVTEWAARMVPGVPK